MDDRALSDLRLLAERDQDLERRERTLQELDDRVRTIKERAEAIERFFAHYDDARRRAQSALEAAQAEVERRSREVTEAEASLAAERDEERRELARRALARAEDHRSVALVSLARAEQDLVQLEQEARDRQEELAELAQMGRALSAQLPELEPPSPDLSALKAWASQAHAELFVAVRQIETERERVIREANELATALLGEPTFGSTPAQALARVEHSV